MARRKTTDEIARRLVEEWNAGWLTSLTDQPLDELIAAIASELRSAEPAAGPGERAKP